MSTQTFVCPTCGQKVTTPATTATCTHKGTPRQAARPAVMQPIQPLPLEAAQ